MGHVILLSLYWIMSFCSKIFVIFSYTTAWVLFYFFIFFSSSKLSRNFQSPFLKSYQRTSKFIKLWFQSLIFFRFWNSIHGCDHMKVGFLAAPCLRQKRNKKATSSSETRCRFRLGGGPQALSDILLQLLYQTLKKKKKKGI